MKLRELCEEFKDAVKKYGKYFEIYENPTNDELRKMFKEGIIHIRYIYTKREQALYVFSADLLHKLAADKLGIKYSMASRDNIVLGQGRITIKGRIFDFYSVRTGKKDLFKGTRVEHIFEENKS